MHSNNFINFPSQAVSDKEKMSPEYGLEVAKAIKHEWFNENGAKFKGNFNTFRKLRLYARGEQSIQKYKR